MIQYVAIKEGIGNMKEKTIEFSLSSMIRECSINPKLAFEEFNDIALKNRENIHDTFKYKKFNDDFVSTLAVYCDENQLVGAIKPSYEFFIERLTQLLNADVDLDKVTDDELTTILLNRIEFLKTIRKERDLKKHFPLLYNDLIEGRKYYNSLQKFKKKNPHLYTDGEHYYYSCALKKSLPNFINTQVDMYQRYVKKRQELKAKYDKTTFNYFIKKYMNLDKIALFMAHNYLLACETSNDRAEINKYLKKVILYLRNPKIDRGVKIHSDNNVETNIDVILNKIDRIRDRLNSNNSTVDWVLIPKGRNYKTSTKSQTAKIRTTLMNHEELQALQKIGRDRNSFYESTNYIAKVIGLGKYKGYIGYIYKNGQVILDMEYAENRPYTAKGNAIYNLSVCDFEELSKLSKQELQNHPRVKRFCHIKNWKDNISKIVEKEATEIDEHNSNLLVKRLKRKALY